LKRFDKECAFVIAPFGIVYNFHFILQRSLDSRTGTNLLGNNDLVDLTSHHLLGVAAAAEVRALDAVALGLALVRANKARAAGLAVAATRRQHTGSLLHAAARARALLATGAGLARKLALATTLNIIGTTRDGDLSSDGGEHDGAAGDGRNGTTLDNLTTFDFDFSRLHRFVSIEDRPVRRRDQK